MIASTILSVSGILQRLVSWEYSRLAAKESQLLDAIHSTHAEEESLLQEATNEYERRKAVLRREYNEELRRITGGCKIKHNKLMDKLDACRKAEDVDAKLLDALHQLK